MTIFAIRAAALALPIVLSQSTAWADSASYTGTWQVALTRGVYLTNAGYAHARNSTHCVALTDDGSGGRPHSGGAVVDRQYSGQFQVFGRTLLITISVPGDYGTLASWIFSTSATNGRIGAFGAFDNIQGGVSYSSADTAFAAKAGC